MQCAAAQRAAVFAVQQSLEGVFYFVGYDDFGQESLLQLLLKKLQLY
ncbi:hypothetical protein [Sphingobacterium paludis]|uniref:Uncharacterized protein n=1 Tax=Sphingobacterium paludis TaxID=1476465 RepID=A0A4R7CXE4_9SPHI|nr:hypothetical protein [Sphingobacterium paludis]TDS13199.1 hypothetical protein B0I21_105333 [Sphingobacterium paludis]